MLNDLAALKAAGPPNDTLVDFEAGSDDYLVLNMEKRVQAHDVNGQNHRAREWRGAKSYIGDAGPVEVVRRTQKTWADAHPDQLLTWAFPTKRRDCLKINFRAAEKFDSLTSKDFRMAFEELAQGCPSTVVRSISYLYLNYLQIYHKRIQAQGRHLLMIKVYEGKGEAHCWHIPLREVRDLHKQAAEAMRGGVSLNDVQLVETYAVENTFAIHAETFSQGEAGQRGNQYGQCNWVGGMALHLITEERDSPVKDKSQEFAMVPDEHLAELAEKQAKLREKRSRKKTNRKTKKAEVVALQTVEDQLARQQEDAAATALRKQALVQPHASLSRMFKAGASLDEASGELSGEVEASSEEEDTLGDPQASVLAQNVGKVQPHASLSNFLIDHASSSLPGTVHQR